MSSQNTSKCCAKPKWSAIDPVCGMLVDDPNALQQMYQNTRYYFCAAGCLQRFSQQPEQYVSETKSNCCSRQNAVKPIEPVATAQIQTSGCCAQPALSPSNTAVDPVCGMQVSVDSPLQSQYQNQPYYFCHQSCLDKFEQTPAYYLLPIDFRRPALVHANQDYTCPMDPEIVQQGAGTCPICGMALEPMQPSLDEQANPELVDFSHRFWNTLPLTLLVFVLAMGSHVLHILPAHIQPWIELLLSLPVVFWAGQPILKRCFDSYVSRHLNMWSLIGVGVVAAFAYSVVATILPQWIPMQAKTGHGVAVYFEAACMIVSLSLLGQILELKAREKTANALKSLLRLQPATAKMRYQQQLVEVPISHLRTGDIIYVAAQESIPLDGIIVQGCSYIEQAMLTGEALPVKKTCGDRVIGGTVNQDTGLDIQVDAVANDTVLAQMIDAVAQAQRSKAPLQRLADAVAKYFVLAVLAISLLTFIAWMFWGNAQFDLALMCAVAVLVIACPCALGLATPMSVMAITGRAAQKGILFKDAAVIERLNQVDTLIIDKTGTLTEGQPSLQQFILLQPELDLQQLKCQVASMEQYSYHPIAKTLAQLVEPAHYLAVENFQEIAGFGVQAQIDGQQLYVGGEQLIEQLQLHIEPQWQQQWAQLRQQGQSITVLANQQQLLAVISIQDAIKSHAQQVITHLREQNIEIIIASGDHQDNVDLVAKALGIEQAYGQCTPQDKRQLIEKYQANGKVVAMAGDGINDAPALAQADIGIAMGNGTDIAKQTAAITLVKGDLRGIQEALHLAGLGVKNMKQNLAFSLLYNGLGVPVAAGVFYPILGILLTPMFAAVAMSLSSLSVVLNALRLQKAK